MLVEIKGTQLIHHITDKELRAVLIKYSLKLKKENLTKTIKANIMRETYSGVCLLLALEQLQIISL